MPRSRSEHLRRWLTNIVDLARRKLGWAQDVDPNLNIYRSRDQQDNEDSSLPPGEVLDLCCVWGVEFYTPTHVPGLVDALNGLGWESEHRSEPYRSPVSWIRSLRRRQHGGASMHLGVLTRTGERIFLGPHHHAAPLPSYFKYAHVRLYSISPSLIGVVICFVLEEQEAAQLNSILKKERRTYTTPIRNGARIHHPSSQKEQDILQLRESLSAAIAAWFREHLPGVFSSGTLDGHVPTCELITTLQTEPFPSSAERDTVRSEYLRLLELDYGLDIWHSERIPGLRFQNSRKAQHHSIVSIREQECISALKEHNPSTDKRSRIWFLDEAMSDMIAAWSTVLLLEGYTQQIIKVRDAALTSHGGTINALEAASDSMLHGLDVSAVAIEVADMAREKFWFFLDDPEFRGPNHAPAGSEVSLRDQLYRSIEGTRRSGFRGWNAAFANIWHNTVPYSERGRTFRSRRESLG